MKKRFNLPSLPLTLFLFLAGVVLSIAQNQTALDRYIAKPDHSYKYSLHSTVPGQGFQMFVIEMVSQNWRSASEVDRTEWKHWLTIIKPDQVKSDKGFLFISGGGNGSPAPSKPEGFTAQIALATGTVVAELKMVPNQPIVFKGETRGRSEDSLIAYTWDKFLRGGDETWPARLPMTKSAVRALDTITSFCASEAGGKVKVEQFVVAGGSKRGWTTWTTAAVDKRVIAIAPFVIDMLNIEPSFEHHFKAYGFYAPAVGDYQAMKIMDWSGTKEYKDLMTIEEPFQYRDRLTLPKFIINSTGDQFFLPDSWRFYYSELKGPKYLRYVPNTDHGLGKSDAVESLLAFYSAVIQKKPLPELNWKAEKDGALRVTVSGAKPATVKLWQASNADARDFRLEKIGPAWTSQDLKAEADGSFLAKVAKPEKGFTAYLVEATFKDEQSPAPLKLTSGVHVIPDVLPHTFIRPTPPVKQVGQK